MELGIQKEGQEKKFLELCEKTLGEKFSIVDVDCHVMGRSLLRVFIEPKGQEQDGKAQHTGLEHCSEASRLLDVALETDPVVNGQYDLEVSSPGLDRRVRTYSDFEKNVGSTLELRFIRKLEELGLGAKSTAELVGVDPESIRIKSSGQEYAVPWNLIRQANIKAVI